MALPTTPINRNGKESQFGIRRLRISTTVATTKIIRVGHQATFCIMCFSGYRGALELDPSVGPSVNYVVYAVSFVPMLLKA
jgi:hypothetical protein